MQYLCKIVPWARPLNSFAPLYKTLILYCSLKSKFDCLLICLWQMINSVTIESGSVDSFSLLLWRWLLNDVLGEAVRKLTGPYPFPPTPSWYIDSPTLTLLIVTVVAACAKKVTTDLFSVRIPWAASQTLCCTPQVVTPMPTPITSLNWTASTWSPSTTAGRPPNGPTTWTRASGNNRLVLSATSQMQQLQPSRLLHLKPSSHSCSTAF